jgi:hypothetical protein
MTGYYIHVGYNSSHDSNEVWKELEKIGLELCDNPNALAQEAYHYDKFSLVDLRRFAEPFKERKDLTIRFKDRLDGIGNSDDFRPYIVMYASGGGQDRLLKESLRRAFIRLVLAKMHLRQMEIDIAVG